jgi:hypothetical protein
MHDDAKFGVDEAWLREASDGDICVMNDRVLLFLDETRRKRDTANNDKI